METLKYLVAYSLIFAFGASAGSFLNVVIYRLPNDMSLVYPPSHCPNCSHRLGRSENVPVLGWLWLRGRCRWCRTPIPPRYPAIECLAGILFGAVFYYFSFSLETVGYWAFLSWLLALAFIDLDTMTLPDALTRSGLLLGLVFQTALGWQDRQGGLYLFEAILGAVAGIGLFDLIRWGGTLALGQPAMGGGDPKLAATIGAWLGWQGLLVTAFLACLAGSAIGAGGLLLGKTRRGQPIPFGPFLVLGAIASVFWKDPLVATYKTLFFPGL